MQGKDLLTPKYTSITQATRTVVAEEGALALWKGNGANVLRVIPVYGLKFAFNDSIKLLVAGPSKRKLDVTDLLWVGTLAGLMQTALTYPLETVRTRLTLGPEQGVRYNGISDCFKQILKTEGTAGLCVALGETVALLLLPPSPIARARQPLIPIHTHAHTHAAGSRALGPPWCLARPILASK